MGVVLHKDSKWYQQWKDFKDNNVVFNSKDHLTSSFSVSVSFSFLHSRVQLGFKVAAAFIYWKKQWAAVNY